MCRNSKEKWEIERKARWGRVSRSGRALGEGFRPRRGRASEA
jgi:hypothetical protein